jgi:hypothetical protein
MPYRPRSTDVSCTSNVTQNIVDIVKHPSMANSRRRHQVPPCTVASLEKQEELALINYLAIFYFLSFLLMRFNVNFSMFVSLLTHCRVLFTFSDY